MFNAAINGDPFTFTKNEFGRDLCTSLRGATRRSNPERLVQVALDCFGPAGLAMTRTGAVHQSPETAGRGRALAVRSCLSRSARRKARSSDCSALRRGSQTV